MNITTHDEKTEYLYKEFRELAETYIHRQGISELLTWLDTTDFYVAPASTKYHGSVKGGLVEHSITVFKELQFLVQGYNGLDGTTTASRWNEVIPNTTYTMENLAIVSLFHDFCKIGTYKTEYRNVKEGDTWISKAFYSYKEDFVYGGHGSKSVYLVMKYLKLTDAEAAAINCHMASWDLSNYNKPGEVFQCNPLAWLLHVADESATYMKQK